VKIRTGIALVAMMAATTMTTAFAQGTGADTYKAKCQMCHAADGTASGPAGKSMNVPSFKTSKMTEAQMVAETKAGKGKMPAFAGKLTDAQITGVVGYIRALK
jgi:cytochrome c6